MTALLAVVALVMQTAPTLTVSKADPLFADIKTFRCDLGEGVGRELEPQKARSNEAFGEVIFDNVDYRNRSARLIGNVGSSTVQVIDGELAVSFIETTSVGGVVITSIFKATQTSPYGPYKAALSRHLAYTIDNQASATQYYGTCRGLI